MPTELEKLNQIEERIKQAKAKLVSKTPTQPIPPLPKMPDPMDFISNIMKTPTPTNDQAETIDARTAAAEIKKQIQRTTMAGAIGIVSTVILLSGAVTAIIGTAIAAAALGGVGFIVVKDTKYKKYLEGKYNV